MSPAQVEDIRSTQELQRSENKAIQNQNKEIDNQWDNDRIQPAKNNLICEKIATLTNKQLRRPVDVEASARGAAYFAGISCGIWKESTLPEPELKDTVEPSYNERDWSVTEFSHWQGSIRRVLKWQQLEAEAVDDCLSVHTTD